jgi:hypothetical protein
MPKCPLKKRIRARTRSGCQGRMRKEGINLADTMAHSKYSKDPMATRIQGQGNTYL